MQKDGFREGRLGKRRVREGGHWDGRRGNGKYGKAGLGARSAERQIAGRQSLEKESAGIRSSRRSPIFLEGGVWASRKTAC